MSGTTLYRGMRPDRENPQLPRCGESAACLGVRRCDVSTTCKSEHKCDIPIHGGLVHPASGGMSVVVDDPEELPAHRQPKDRNGVATGHQVFSIETDEVPSTLVVRSDNPLRNPSHRVIEPKEICSFEIFVQNLHSTQASWRLVA